jgi:hypothetical protein
MVRFEPRVFVCPRRLLPLALNANSSPSRAPVSAATGTIRDICTGMELASSSTCFHVKKIGSRSSLSGAAIVSSPGSMT